MSPPDIPRIRSQMQLAKCQGSPLFCPPPSLKSLQRKKNLDLQPKCSGFKSDNAVLTGSESGLSRLIIFRVTTKLFVQCELQTERLPILSRQLWGHPPPRVPYFQPVFGRDDMASCQCYGEEGRSHGLLLRLRNRSWAKLLPPGSQGEIFRGKALLHSFLQKNRYVSWEAKKFDHLVANQWESLYANAKSGQLVGDVTISFYDLIMSLPLKRPAPDCSSYRQDNSPQAEHLLDCSWSVGTKVSAVQVTESRKTWSDEHGKRNPAKAQG